MATAIPTACLASSAIRCRDVETGPNLGVLAVFPSNGATLPVPPSLHGVSWAQFPRFGGTMRHSDSSPSIPPRFVAFARRYHPSTCSSLRRTPGATSTASGLVSRCPRDQRQLFLPAAGAAVAAASPTCKLLSVSGPEAITASTETFTARIFSRARVATTSPLPSEAARSATALRERPQADVHAVWSSASSEPAATPTERCVVERAAVRTGKNS